MERRGTRTSGLQITMGRLLVLPLSSAAAAAFFLLVVVVATAAKVGDTANKTLSDSQREKRSEENGLVAVIKCPKCFGEYRNVSDTMAS